MNTLLMIGGLLLLALILLAFKFRGGRGAENKSASRAGDGTLPAEPDAGSSIPPSNPQIPSAPLVQGSLRDGEARETDKLPGEAGKEADEGRKRDRAAAGRRAGED